MSASSRSRRARLVRAALTVLLAGALPSCGEKPPTPPPAASTLAVTIFAMPVHGLAIAIRTPSGKTCLIDAGGKSEGYDAGRDTIAPWLKAHGVDRIDTLVVSHPDHDHYGGAPYLFDHFKIDHFVDGGIEGKDVHQGYLRLRKEAPKRGDYRVVADGDSLSWDPALKVDVLSPPKGGLKPEKDEDPNLTNNNSLVLRVEHGKNVFLFPGDIQRNARDSVLTRHRADALKATVLVAPHHGFSHGKRFAEVTRPETVVVSCLAEYPGKEIVSPGKEAKDFYGSHGAKVYVTAWDGTIEITSDGATTAVRAGR